MRHDTAINAADAVSTAPIAPKDEPGAQQGFALKRYRVSNFRSVSDSGWLDAARVTALIGVNESGKTNLLMPLWKLNPAGDGGIEPTSDYPKLLFGTIRQDPGAFQFITAEFDTGSEAQELAEIARIPVDAARIVSVGRCYDGKYTVSFPLHQRRSQAEQRAVAQAVENARTQIVQGVTEIGQEELKTAALETLDAIVAEVRSAPVLTGNDMMRLRNQVAALIPVDPPATSQIIVTLRDLRKMLGTHMAELIAPDPGQVDAVRDAVLMRMPIFVYYSNFGNLDSEIYLPHVVENMHRSDLGAKEAAKARTLRVLFGFVGLQAEEILQLGRDFRDIREEAEKKMIEQDGKRGLLRSLVQRARGIEEKPDQDVLSQIAEAKRTRSILLQSAGTKLTERFAEWWKQGDYRFRFEADGSHFRIWVADKRRPQEVELEHRSTGLQWFLSFFLVFLHESRGAHHRAVLLLDEPGLSLHPLAQRDLSAFFDGLAATNQIIYTSHSPFLVDADRLERARKVYVGRDGSTRVTADLREAEGSDSQTGAAYVVRAALNMAVAEASLGGTQAVLVPGSVDQVYLSAIRTLLIRDGLLRPKRDLVFAPATGPNVMQVMAAMLAQDDVPPPPVIHDASPAGRKLGAALRAADSAALGHAISLPDLLERAEAQIEDLLPIDRLAAILDRMERRPDVMFGDICDPTRPFVPQVEAWAAKAGITLAGNWRQTLAHRMRTQLLARASGDLPRPVVDTWSRLMDALQG